MQKKMFVHIGVAAVGLGVLFYVAQNCGTDYQNERSTAAKAGDSSAPTPAANDIANDAAPTDPGIGAEITPDPPSASAANQFSECAGLEEAQVMELTDEQIGRVCQMLTDIEFKNGVNEEREPTDWPN